MVNDRIKHGVVRNVYKQKYFVFINSIFVSFKDFKDGKQQNYKTQNKAVDDENICIAFTRAKKKKEYTNLMKN